ncbi:MAG: hypothetical protein ACODAA_05095 [Gemmatimonadota bacterium]
MRDREAITSRRLRTRRTIPAAYVLAGGLLAGTLDLVFAMVFWALKADVSALQILQGVASGLSGPAAFQGGLSTAGIGLALHYGIALTMAIAYFLAVRRVPALWQRPVRTGCVYGLALYVIMNQLVVPLSAAAPGSTDPTWIASNVVVHVVLIGIPIAVFVRLAIMEGRSRKS